MIKFFLIIIFILKFNVAFAENNLIFFLESAYNNNPKLNAARENLKATRQNINISKSEFLPNLSVSASVNSTESFNRKSHAGTSLSDSNKETAIKEFSVDQQLFSGFKNYNSIKKSELEVKKASSELHNMEQTTILNAATAFLDLIYKKKSKIFNSSNVSLFERQVESDSVRLQKGEITLTDLAQSESSLAGARAKLISADNELLTIKQNFQRITNMGVPNEIVEKIKININLPKTLSESLNLSQSKNPKLKISKLNSLIAKKELNIEKALISPSASINYSKSETNDFSSTIDTVDEESVKATVSWPIIKGGKNYSSIKKSKFKKKQSELILQDTLNEVKTNTTNAWSLYKSSNSILESTEAQVQAAEIANEGITLEYDSGNTRTTLEVIQSRSLLLDARIANAKAERDFIVSKFKLLEAVGDLTLQSIKNQ